jgi:hypothetical protein
VNDIIEPVALPEILIKKEPKAVLTLYSIAVMAMAIAVILVILGGIGLAAFDKALPDYVVALGSVMAGGLVTLVAKNE